MDPRNRITFTMLVFIVAAVIFILNETLSLDTKIQIYRFFACRKCPHAEKEEYIKQMNQQIEEFKRMYPNLDEIIEKKEFEREQCLKKLSANQLEASKEELQACEKTIEKIIEEMAQFNEEFESQKKAFEQDFEDFEDPIIVD